MLDCCGDRCSYVRQVAEDLAGLQSWMELGIEWIEEVG